MNYDLAVIGGGVHGAGIAQAAAAAGYSVVLLEAADWAGATSSRSSKLIHGGLRYLESGQLNLVYHSLRERQLLLRLAPQLVRPQRFYIPVYPDSQRRPWQLRVGLSGYAVLAGLGQYARYHRLQAADWQQWPALRQAGLQAVFQYWDAQTDDQALTLAVLDSARRLGADLRAGTRVEAIASGHPHWLLHTAAGTVRARAVVNAAGPWVNTVTAMAGLPQQPIALVQGSHLVLDQPLPLPGVWYLEASDGRAVFAMPWQGGTLLGTTEVEVAGPDPAPGVSAAESNYLLATLRRYLPDFAPAISAQFAGLRVLPAGDGSPFRRSRETLLVGNTPGQPSWISIYGGKLTTYRHTALRAIRQLQPCLGKRAARADTARLMLQPCSAAELDLALRQGS